MWKTKNRIKELYFVEEPVEESPSVKQTTLNSNEDLQMVCPYQQNPYFRRKINIVLTVSYIMNIFVSFHKNLLFFVVFKVDFKTQVHITSIW